MESETIDGGPAYLVVVAPVICTISFKIIICNSGQPLINACIISNRNPFKYLINKALNCINFNRPMHLFNQFDPFAKRQQSIHILAF